jgi:hypothetical protein
MFWNHSTLPQKWPLQSGSTNQPTLTPGAQTTFQHQDVPDRSPTGPLAYYLPGDLVTFTGNVVQATGSGIVYSDRFFSCLFTSLAWTQAWHGTPVQSSHVLGTQWAVTEYMIGGQRYSSAVKQIVAPIADGTYPFEITIFVPFSSCLLGDLQDDTSQLALLARASQLQINVAPASVLTAISTNATITNFKARASAVLVPRQSMVLGTPIETILTQVVAGAGNSIKITNFGTDTGLQGVDPGGGVLGLEFLTSVNNQGGSFISGNITDFVFNWRGQQYTQDILGLLSLWKRLLPPPLQSGFTMPNSASPGGPLVGMPYSVANGTVIGPSAAANGELANLLFWALVLSGNDPRLTNLQTADSDQTFNQTVTGGYSGTHQILGHYARSWQKRMLDNWLAQVFAGGSGSLAAYVLGPQYGSYKLCRRGPAGKHFTSVDEARYLPWMLCPPSAVK